jgi:hypothetical protein
MVTEYKHKQEMRVVDEMIQLAGSGGRCVLGSKVVTALEQRRVELLIVPWPSANEKLVDRLTLEALAAGADVKPVGGEAAERLIGECGVVARVYYNSSTYDR